MADMSVLRVGTIIDAAPNDQSFDGRSGKGWVLKVVKEENVSGFYIYYSSPIFPNEGYDDWFEDEVVLEEGIRCRIERNGWKIKWNG